MTVGKSPNLLSIENNMPAFRPSQLLLYFCCVLH